MELKKGQTVYIKNENPKLQNTPVQGRIHSIHPNHVVLRTSGGTGLYKAHKDNISHDSKDNWMSQKYRKEDVNEGVKKDKPVKPHVYKSTSTEYSTVHRKTVNPYTGSSTSARSRKVTDWVAVVNGKKIGGHNTKRDAVATWHKLTNRVNEDAVAPTNSAGGGNIAGIGVGPKGEPGVSPKVMSKYKRGNQDDAPSTIMAPMQQRKTLKQFMQGD